MRCSMECERGAMMMGRGGTEGGLKCPRLASSLPNIPLPPSRLYVISKHRPGGESHAMRTPPFLGVSLRVYGDGRLMHDD